MQNVLIVVSGKAQSGKSTASEILKKLILDRQHTALQADTERFESVQRSGDDFEVVERRGGHQGWALWKGRVYIYSFAKALKDIARQYFGWDGDKGIYYKTVQDTPVMEYDPANGHHQEPIPDHGRQLLINIGKKFREIRPTIWVDYVVNAIKEEGKEGKDKVFMIDDLRFRNELELVKTFQPCISIRLTRAEQLNLSDLSETDLDNSTFDYYVENNGSIEEFTEKLTKIFDEISEKCQ